jgi:hypothetical protein
VTTSVRPYSPDPEKVLKGLKNLKDSPEPSEPRPQSPASKFLVQNEGESQEEFLDRVSSQIDEDG